MFRVAMRMKSYYAILTQQPWLWWMQLYDRKEYTIAETLSLFAHAAAWIGARFAFFCYHYSNWVSTMKRLSIAKKYKKWWMNLLITTLMMTKMKNTSNYAIVIPTNRSVKQYEWLLQSIKNQSLLPDQIIIVVDKEFIDRTQYEEYIDEISQSLGKKCADRVVVVTHLTDDFVVKHNASYVRNRWINHVDTKRLATIDDDNEFDQLFFENLIRKYTMCEQNNQAPCLLIPTEYYRDTDQIWLQWYKRFNHRLSRQQSHRVSPTSHEMVSIQFSASNFLFGATELFKKFPFPEEVPFVYEDYIMTRSLYRWGYSLFLVPDLAIHHMMRNKTKIEHMYIHTTRLAYQKARNKIWFVQSTSTTREKLSFYGVGLRGHTVYLMLIALFYGKITSVFPIWWALLRGTIHGLFKPFHYIKRGL